MKTKTMMGGIIQNQPPPWTNFEPYRCCLPADKYSRYRDYIAANLHVRKYGIHSVRVVTVTETRARAASLCTLVSDILPRDSQKAFRFATLEDLPLGRPGTFFDPVFIHPHDFREGKRYRLLPPPRSFTDPRQQS